MCKVWLSLSDPDTLHLITGGVMKLVIEHEKTITGEVFWVLGDGFALGCNTLNEATTRFEEIKETLLTGDGPFKKVLREEEIAR